MKKAENIQIRKAESTDLIQVYGLIKELAIFEKAPDQPSNPLEKFIQEGSAKQPRFQVLVAEQENEIVGMAMYYFGYSSWKGSMLYLDDLVVKEVFRGHGIGKQLMDELLNIAKEERVSLVFWQVLDWNEKAIQFYKQYPVTFDAQWVNVKMDLSKAY